MDKKRVVIALGGNALGKDIEEQKQAVAKTAEAVSYTHLRAHET